MDDPPGEFLASGAAADVYDLGDGTVLRRYRTDHDTATEASLMTWLSARGVPVPVVTRADGRDLVMELIDGPTMLEDLQRRPWRILRHGRTLACIQRQLASLSAPSWLQPDEHLEDGRSVLHLDLHPMNVLLGPSGPVLIDWSNACRGPAGADAATTYLLMTGFEVSGWRDRAGRWALSAAFTVTRGIRLVRRHLVGAARRRLLDPNLTDHERAHLTALLRQRGAA